MPATNPFVDSIDGNGVVYTPGVEALITQNPRPGALAGIAGGTVNPAGASAGTQVNAAGTSENVNWHVAALIGVALLGAFGLNKAGFRFAGTASVGFGRS